MKIQVFIRNVYGVEKTYPYCKDALSFATIAGTSTLTLGVILCIKDLGYEIEVVPDPHSQLGKLMSA